MTLVRMLPLCLKLTTTNPTSFLIYLTLPYLYVSSNYFVLTKMVYLLYLFQIFLSASISGMILVVVVFFFGKRVGHSHWRKKPMLGVYIKFDISTGGPYPNFWAYALRQ